MDHPRIVVKVGSSSLTSEEGGLDPDRVAYYADELAALHRSGVEVLLVTSGAVAAGFPALGYANRPKKQHEKQASAAVGQGLLMQAWIDQLASRGITAAQILLSGSDLRQPARMNSVHLTVDELLNRGAIPIFNENDTVPIRDVRFGDNDRLSAVVANLCGADRLLIFTDMDGLYTADPRKDPTSRRIRRVKAIDEGIFQMAGGAGSGVGTGGMHSKLEAAWIATRGGVDVFIGKADRPGDITAAATGQGRGTEFDSGPERLSLHEMWDEVEPRLGAAPKPSVARNSWLSLA